MPRKTELSPWFAQHYQKNKHFYDDIVGSCTSLEELILQTDLAGTKWGAHDWAVILSKIITTSCLLSNAHAPESENYDSTLYLFNNILNGIDTNTTDPEIPNIFTNNVVIKALVLLHMQIESLKHDFAPRLSHTNSNVFFAHLFNRWPKLAKMPYMFSTYRKIKRHIILRCYIRSTKNSDNQIITYISSSPNTLQSSTTTFEQCLSDFINRHLEKSPGQA